MNILDLAIGIILILFAISGLKRGLIIEAFYLAYLFNSYCRCKRTNRKNSIEYNLVKKVMEDIC